jgi:hypothetical protein
VIEAEVAPHGLASPAQPAARSHRPTDVPLPHVEIASHTYAHPFVWDPDLGRQGREKRRKNIAEGNYHLGRARLSFRPDA